MDLGDVLDEPRFEGAPTLLPEAREHLRRIVVERGLEKTLAEWMDVFINRSDDVAAEPFMTSQEGMNHPQVVHNQHVVEVTDPAHRSVRGHSHTLTAILPCTTNEFHTLDGTVSIKLQ